MPSVNPTASTIPFNPDLRAALVYADLCVRRAVARARGAGLHPDDEFRGLYISEEQVDALLDMEFGRAPGFPSNGHTADEWEHALGRARAEAFHPSGLFAALQHTFHLDGRELEILALALLPELDRRYERLFAYLQDDVTQKRPTVDLLLNLLTTSFGEKLHLRERFTEDGALVRERLLHCFPPSGSAEPPLLSHYVRPAPRLVEHLLGQQRLDPSLTVCARLDWCADDIDAPPLPNDIQSHLPEQPLFAFSGSYGAGQTAAARQIARSLDVPLIVFDVEAAGDERWELLRVALRDGCLLRAVLLLENWDAALIDGRPDPRLLWPLLAYHQIVIVSGTAEWQARQRPSERPIYPIAFSVPDFDARRALWETALADTTIDLGRIANHFRFTPGQIRDAVATARDQATWEQTPLAERHLLAAGRAHSNQRLSELATKIRPRYTWRDIVLPNDTLRMLREMVNTVRHRPQVYGQWGFGQKLALGRGLNALFAGESGTGKTMAADIIANELGLDLYKIDLSTVVSKYIGETEKNLGRIFHEAETSNAVLFFDEADALFGKRSEVKDSHDRYANIETGYLLQRMEAFDGVVILATNLRANLDEAFTRRLHFIVEFPFPDVADRERIWRVNVPAATPLAAGVDFRLLAERFRISGGSIRNIILAAAFLAAEDGATLGMSHLLHATRREYQKRGRLINEALFAGVAD